MRTYYCDLLFNAEETKSFAAVATPIEHTNEQKEDKQKDKHKKDKDKETSEPFQNKNHFVIIMSIPNNNNQNLTSINNPTSGSDTTSNLLSFPTFVPIHIDLENLFTVREEESNVVSASPIMFGRRIWGRGERKVTPRQLATLTDNILAELPLMSKYDKVFERFIFVVVLYFSFFLFVFQIIDLL
jgi:hypothetical protein